MDEKVRTYEQTIADMMVGLYDKDTIYLFSILSESSIEEEVSALFFFLMINEPTELVFY